MTPNTTVELYATPLDISNKFVIYAESRDAAYSICQNWPKQVFTNCYWERENFVFRCNGNINDLEQYNYCVFINDGHYNFAFITGYQYINDAMTQISLQIDPWFNYAGLIDFENSSAPMKRCHPVTADENIYNYNNPEPIDVNMWFNADQEQTSLDTSVPDEFYLVSAVNSNSFQGQATNIFDALGQLMIGNGSALGAAFSALTVTFCDCDTVMQMPTAHVSASDIAQIIKDFTAAGQQNLLISIYYIPKDFDTLAGSSVPVVSAVTKKNFLLRTLRIPGSLKSVYRMAKIWRSDQFVKIDANFLGRHKVYHPSEFETAAITDGAYTFQIFASQNYSGCPVFYFTQYLTGAESSAIYGPEWTKVAFSAAGVTPGALGYNLLDISKYLLNMVSGAGGLASTVVKAVSGGDELYKSISERQKGETDIVGSNGDNYGNMFMVPDSISVNLMVPSAADLVHIATFFGTYGYNMAHYVQSLSMTRRRNRYPYWVYFETDAATIIAPEVPQNAISDIIRQFNSGTFVFWDAENFKTFNHAMSNWPS